MNFWGHIQSTDPGHCSTLTEAGNRYNGWSGTQMSLFCILCISELLVLTHQLWRTSLFGLFFRFSNKYSCWLGASNSFNHWTPWPLPAWTLSAGRSRHTTTAVAVCCVTYVICSACLGLSDFLHFNSNKEAETELPANLGHNTDSWEIRMVVVILKLVNSGIWWGPWLCRKYRAFKALAAGIKQEQGLSFL